MRLKRLALSHLRNITRAELEPREVLNFFVGDNAQGKTSLIEALYFLSTLKSFRTTHPADLIQFGQPLAQISARVESKTWSTPQEMKVRLSANEKKLVLNEKTVGASSFIGRLKVVVFSPESLMSIKAGPDARRALVDEAVFQLSQTGAAAQTLFKRALRQRNACLRQMREGQLVGIKGRQVLESLDLGYVNAAAEVTAERLKFLDALFPLQNEILKAILGESCELDFTYESGDMRWQERTLADVRARILAELDAPARRVAEESLGTTLTGPHRHDLSFLFNRNDSRIFCSQGQQRALILAFKIAEIVYHSKTFGAYPLLLLDDVLSEFDEKKRRFLIDFLRTNEAQTFLTTTDSTQVLQGSSVYHMESGRLN